MPIEYVAMMVPFAAISVGYLAVWTHHRRKMMDRRAAISAAQAKESAVHVEELRQRVQVLERIVTDSGFEVSQKIEDLRSAPLASTFKANGQPNAEQL